MALLCIKMFIYQASGRLKQHCISILLYLKKEPKKTRKQFMDEKHNVESWDWFQSEVMVQLTVTPILNITFYFEGGLFQKKLVFDMWRSWW